MLVNKSCLIRNESIKKILAKLWQYICSMSFFSYPKCGLLRTTSECENLYSWNFKDLNMYTLPPL